MSLTLLFAKNFLFGIFYGLPLLFVLLLLITLIGLKIGRIEGWSKFDSFYYSMITATTVGYGDLSPQARSSKLLAIVIALLGLLFTGLVVAVGVHAATAAFEGLYLEATS